MATDPTVEPFSETEMADWCEQSEGFAICGTRMKEVRRESVGIKWCFACRKRAAFEFVVIAPDGLSYYGPEGYHECTNCKARESDLFPGWTREYED